MAGQIEKEVGVGNVPHFDEFVAGGRGQVAAGREERRAEDLAGVAEERGDKGVARRTPQGDRVVAGAAGEQTGRPRVAERKNGAGVDVEGVVEAEEGAGVAGCGCCGGGRDGRGGVG